MLSPAQLDLLVRLYREDGAGPNQNRTWFEFGTNCEKVSARPLFVLMISGFVEVKEGRLHVTARGREFIATIRPHECRLAKDWNYPELETREYS